VLHSSARRDRAGLSAISTMTTSRTAFRSTSRSPRARRGVIANRAASYVLGRLLRTREKYITAKAASNTPPTIKIMIVTMLNSHRLDLIISVLVATGMSDA
jgi:hypothetical protein